METIEWPHPKKRGRWRILLLIVLGAVFLGGRTAVSYYVESLWFGSLGFGDVFWRTIGIQGTVFVVFTLLTLLILWTCVYLLKPERLAELTGGVVLINGQPLRLPVAAGLRFISLAVSGGIALLTGFGMMAAWQTLALYWYGRDTIQATSDPIFGKSIDFYLFTLPAWELITGWLTTLAVIVCLAAGAMFAVTASTRKFSRQRASQPTPVTGLSLSAAALLLMLAVRVYLAQFDRLYESHQIFDGVTYTDAHVWITGMFIVAGALVAGALVAAVNAVAIKKVTWLVAALVPAFVCFIGVTITAWYVQGFIVKPNELVRETPFIAHNIAMTRQAYGLEDIKDEAFPADSGIEALEASNNQETLSNIRLWDWRALRDTLRQIQEIRTYYDFPDIDIDRYEINGAVRQVMLAARELNIERLPVSSRNWINEKLIYTHGYGITMNPVNGFTPEGLPELLLANMPVQSSVPSLQVSRPEIYFGEVTNTDVYVRTHQQEFNYPQGDKNSTTSYTGNGGIAIGGFFRRLLIAIDQGDVSKLPFSDDVTAESRLLMRRNVGDRVQTLAPFLTFDPDPYIVLGDDGRLYWMMDGFTTSGAYPYARHMQLGRSRINYMRNSVKAVVDAYDGTVSFYVFDPADPIIARYRSLFPTLFKDASAMPAMLRKHVRYPELLLEMQAAVYGLYHMTDPAVFYNREDLWTVANEISSNDRQEQAGQPMEPNFVLMRLPGEQGLEFVEILPFTPANRNNLIGWIAGRSDGEHYGRAIAYHFPKNRLVDGPLQIEARIDQDAQLSGQLSLWNQQGSSVRRGSLIVIPVGRALLYAEPIYLQAARSPMPELRVVVLAIQDRLAYGPTFEAALRDLFGPSGAPSTTTSTNPTQGINPRGGTSLAQPVASPIAPGEFDALVRSAAQDLADYQRLTAEGKLGEAGQKLEAVKGKLEELQRKR